jgi:hypothetical protein
MEDVVMAIDDALDVGIDCDECGEHENVDVSGYVHEQLRKRGWKLNTSEGDLCMGCAMKQKDEDD